MQYANFVAIIGRSHASSFRWSKQDELSKSDLVAERRSIMTISYEIYLNSIQLLEEVIKNENVKKIYLAPFVDDDWYGYDMPNAQLIFGRDDGWTINIYNESDLLKIFDTPRCAEHILCDYNLALLFNLSGNELLHPTFDMVPHQYIIEIKS